MSVFVKERQQFRIRTCIYNCLSLNCNFHRYRDCIDPFRHVQLHQMAQHSRLHVNFQPWRTNIHFVPDHPGRPVNFRKFKFFLSLYKRGDIDLETIKSCRRVSDRQSIGNRPDAMENRILQS